jgi:hypothetical protein
MLLPEAERSLTVIMAQPIGWDAGAIFSSE